MKLSQYSVFIGLAFAMATMASRADSVSATMHERAEGDASGFGYESVEDAFAALSAKEGAIRREGPTGWTEIEDGIENTLWSFAPEEHPAYPSVVRRTIAGVGQSIRIDMDAICESNQAACEALMQNMLKMNEKARSRYLRALPKANARSARQLPIWSLMSGGRAQ